MTSTNHWARPLPGLDEITRDLALVDHLTAETARMLGEAGMAGRDVASRVLNLAQDADQYEARAYTLLGERGLLRPSTRDLQPEIDYLHDLTRPYLIGSSLLDFGSGDSSMARRFARSGWKVTMADVLEPWGEPTTAPFALIRPDGMVPLPDGAFDNAVAYGVLHHCTDPDLSIGELLRVLRPGGRAAVIESVYGVAADEVHPDHPMRATAFPTLTEEQQLHHTMFFDHFANRVLGHYSADRAAKVNMPFNYQTLAGWDATLERHGAVLVDTRHVEVSIGRAPLHHTMHVVEVR